jgi:DUF1365 family protein
MSYEVWIGTPNEMARASTKDTQPAAVKWARDHLDGLKMQARKYDNAAIPAMVSIAEDMGRASTLTEGQSLGWQFNYIAVTYRIEIRRTT